MRETRGLDRLKRLFPAAHWQTISGLAQGGVFDINGCLNGTEIWVELKQAERPKTNRGSIRPKVQPGQPAWEALRTQAGGRCYVAILVGPDFYVLPGWAVRELRDGVSLARLQELKLDERKLFDK